MMEPVEIRDPASFRSALAQALDAALGRGTRTLLFVDPDFAAWPLDDAALLDRLTAFLRRPGRRLTLLAARFDRLDARHPRFAAWRAVWSHAVDARSPDDEAAAGLEPLLLDDGPTLLHCWSLEPLRGRALQDAHDAAAARDRLDAALQRAAPAWPLRPLGL